MEEGRNMKHLKAGFWLVGIVLLLLGIAGWADRFVAGHRDAAYGQVVPWGLWVAGYIFCIGLSAGAFLISSLVYVFGVKRFESVGRLSLFTALVTLIMALLFIWPDIGHMFRAWHVLAWPNFKSPMAWMIWLYSAYMLLLISETYLLMRRDFVLGSRAPGLKGAVYRLLSLGSKDDSEEGERRDHQRVRVLGAIGVPLAIMFHGGVGTLFGILAARPMWNTGLFPLMFLLGALLSGGGLLVFVAYVFQDGMRGDRQALLDLGKLVLGLLALYALFDIAEFLVALRSGIPGHVRPLELMMFGPYWQVFWFLQIGVGMVLPAIILVTMAHSPRAIALAGLLIAVGFSGTRLNIVIPGQAAELLPGLAESLGSPRMAWLYRPSASERLLAAGVIGLGMVLFGLGEMFLPRHSHAKAGATGADRAASRTGAGELGRPVAESL